jgi:Fe-S-cluster containining protein
MDESLSAGVCVNEGPDLTALPCLACAAVNDTCCPGAQVFVTLGDVARIRAFVGRDGFTALEPLDPLYLNDFGDPLWRTLTVRADGRRRVLLRPNGKDCLFLGPHGCFLPEDVRPLLCRLYPYDFTREGITGLCDDCPVALREDREDLLRRMGMPLEKALAWHRLLYDEIYRERSNGAA